jgi:hypothetical protein
MKRVIRFAAGLLLIPLCVAATWALFDLLHALASGTEALFSPEAVWLFARVHALAVLIGLCCRGPCAPMSWRMI